MGGLGWRISHNGLYEENDILRIEADRTGNKDM